MNTDPINQIMRMMELTANVANFEAIVLPLNTKSDFELACAVINKINSKENNV